MQSFNIKHRQSRDQSRMMQLTTVNKWKTKIRQLLIYRYFYYSAVRKRQRHTTAVFSKAPVFRFMQFESKKSSGHVKQNT